MTSLDSTAMQIVLAEDNEADVLLVRLALNSADLNYHLRVLNDGAKTIEFFEDLDTNRQAGPVDLLLLDMHLPKRDGEEILNRLRSTDHYAQTPVIVMTSSDAPSDHALARKHAAMHYFCKPSNLAGFMHLGVIVRDLLSQTQPKEGEAKE